MDYNLYQDKFQSALAKIPKKQFNNFGLKLSVEIVMNSVAIKVYKPEWSSNPQSPLDANSRIFFSIWVNDDSIERNKLWYNIHALKLRQLKGYKISSRDFANQFRAEFMKYQKDWVNADINYGPLTLMQGWHKLKIDNLQKDISELTRSFLNISPIIDTILAKYKIR